MSGAAGGVVVVGGSWLPPRLHFRPVAALFGMTLPTAGAVLWYSGGSDVKSAVLLHNTTKHNFDMVRAGDEGAGKG